MGLIFSQHVSQDEVADLLEGVRADLDTLDARTQRMENLLEQLVASQEHARAPSEPSSADSASQLSTASSLSEPQPPTAQATSVFGPHPFLPPLPLAKQPSTESSTSSQLSTLSGESWKRQKLRVREVWYAGQLLSGLSLPELVARFGPEHPEAARCTAMSELARRLNRSAPRPATISALRDTTALNTLVDVVVSKNSSMPVVEAALEALQEAARDERLGKIALAASPALLDVLGEFMQDRRQLERQELATACVSNLRTQAGLAGSWESLLLGASAVLQSRAASYYKSKAAHVLESLFTSVPAAKSHPTAHAAIAPLVRFLGADQGYNRGAAAQAACVLSALADSHPANQTLVGAEPGAISGLADLMQHGEPLFVAPGACDRTSAANALGALCRGHGPNQSRVLHADNLLAGLEGCEWRDSLVSALQEDSPDFLVVLQQARGCMLG